MTNIQQRSCWLGVLAVHLPRPSPGEVGSRVPFGPLKGTSKGTWLLTSSPASMSAALSRTSFTLTVQLQKPGGQQTLQSAQASNSGETFSVDLMEGTVCAKLIRHPQNNMGVLLLAPCAKGPSGTTIGSQVGLALIKNPAIKATLLKQPVLAFRFLSSGDALAFHDMLQQARHNAQTPTEPPPPPPLLPPPQPHPNSLLPLGGQSLQPKPMQPALAHGMTVAGQQQQGMHATPGSASAEALRPQTVQPTAVDTVQVRLSPSEVEEDCLERLILRCVQEPGFMDYVDRLEQAWLKLEERVQGVD